MPLAAHHREDELVVAAVQLPLRDEQTSPIDAALDAVALMKQAIANENSNNEKSSSNNNKIDLFVLPELAPIGYSEDSFANFLPKTLQTQQIYTKVDELMQNAAKEMRAHVCCGTVGWFTCSNSDDDNDDTTIRDQEGTKVVVTATTNGRDNQKNHDDDGDDDTDNDNNKIQFTIRQVVANPNGDRIAEYDKIHLCNYGDCAETRFFVAGSKLCSFECCDFRVGLIICADMRNPTLSRRLAAPAALHNPNHRGGGVDVILQPAAFSRDISFRTWQSFRETRAVENSVYFVGVNYAGSYYGNTSFVEPWVDQHHEPIVMGTEVGVLVGKVKRSTLDSVRTNMPYYQQLCSEQW